MTNTAQRISRRPIIQGLIFSAIPLWSTGCISSNDGSPKISIFNDAGKDIRADVKIVHLQNEEVVLTETIDIDADDVFRYRKILYDGGMYQLSVSVLSGPSDVYEWNEGENVNGSKGIHVFITDNSILFEEVVE